MSWVEFVSASQVLAYPIHKYKKIDVGGGVVHVSYASLSVEE